MHIYAFPIQKLIQQIFLCLCALDYLGPKIKRLSSLTHLKPLIHRYSTEKRGDQSSTIKAKMMQTFFRLSESTVTCVCMLHLSVISHSVTVHEPPSTEDLGGLYMVIHLHLGEDPDATPPQLLNYSKETFIKNLPSYSIMALFGHIDVLEKDPLLTDHDELYSMDRCYSILLRRFSKNTRDTLFPVVFPGSIATRYE